MLASSTKEGLEDTIVEDTIGIGRKFSDRFVLAPTPTPKLVASPHALPQDLPSRADPSTPRVASPRAPIPKACVISSVAQKKINQMEAELHHFVARLAYPRHPLSHDDGRAQLRCITPPTLRPPPRPPPSES